MVGSARIPRKVLSVWTEWLTWVTDALGAWFAPGWCTKRTPAKTVIKDKRDKRDDDNNNNNNNNNNVRFICGFECTIVILATYRQLRLNHSKIKKKKNQNCIKLSLGCPNSYFYNKRCNMLLWWLYLSSFFFFLNYIMLLLFVNANVIHHV